MRYKLYNIDLQSGDVILDRNEFVFTDPMTWLSAAIRYFTKCQYNHSKIVVTNWGKLFLSEALSNGVVTRPAEEHLQKTKTKIIVLTPVVPIEEQTFCMQANSKLGIPYGYKDLLLNEPIYRLTGIWLGHTKNFAEKAMVCTQFVAWCHARPGWWLYSDKELLADPYFKIKFIEP